MTHARGRGVRRALRPRRVPRPRAAGHDVRRARIRLHGRRRDLPAARGLDERARRRRRPEAVAGARGVRRDAVAAGRDQGRGAHRRRAAARPRRARRRLSDGCPDGHDLLLTATEMLQRSIACYAAAAASPRRRRRAATSWSRSPRSGARQMASRSTRPRCSATCCSAARWRRRPRAAHARGRRRGRPARAAQAAAEGGALDDDAIAERAAAAMQSRTRCYQMKHNAKIVAPHAAQLKASPGLAAWRSAASAVEEPPRGRARRRRRRLRRRRAAAAACPRRLPCRVLRPWPRR